ncbi:restriction endonuclease subunit S [Ureibacillus chungkukjangi]|uniref:restriction endonuclease subunit S n=1 Tax=Ureibacillus chungkukjangi TaxID=1202712 RepID=UPI002040AC6A|nr:restriction endonuclease subunit S [Ureibacillus chungkukjangi]MCM3390233.1 restriction endonuclease subunit S [Ureibacillus chungkukjangi]
MSSNWRVKQLGEVINLKRGYDLPAQDRIHGDIPIMSSSGVNGYHNEKKGNGPGVVTGRSGQLGKVFYTEHDYWPLNTTLYVQDFKGNNPKFIYYLLQTLNLEVFNAGSSVPTLNRNHVHLMNVNVPDYKTQYEIGELLYSFEKKIKLNQSIIKNLYELSQILFKQWFIDFEFPNEQGLPYKSSGGKMVESELGKIPEKWEISYLDKIANYKNGLAMQKYRPLNDESESLPVLKIKELNQGFIDSYSDKCSISINESVKVYDGDVIFSWSGTLLLKLWSGGNAGLNQHLFKVTSNEFEKWFYFLWTNYHLEKFKAIAADKATTMGHIKRTHLSESAVLIGEKRVLEEATKILKPILDKITLLGVENRNLAELRDVLLPKLFSGEIKIPDESVVD